MYASATPKKWRKIGDALLSLSTFLGAYSTIDDWGKTITVVIIVTGALGKFITNLATED